MDGKAYALLAAILALLTLVCPSEAGAKTIAGGLNFAGAIASAGTLSTWGGNGSGQLGNGSTGTNVTTPTQIGSFTTWSAVAAGSNFTVAIATGSALYTWGDNTSGELGNGSTGTNVTTPTQIATSMTAIWSAVAAGSNFAMALRSDGTLWTWGDNTSGELGNGSTGTNVTVPTQVGSFTTWTAIAAGSNFAMAIASDGSLYTWGNNASGQLGNGNSGANVLIPTKIANGLTWTAIAAGSNSSMGISAGNLYTWGNNASGQLGNNTTGTNVLAPTQTGGGTTWTAVAAGSNFAMALTTGGGLCTWGDNTSGELGNGSTGTNVFVPTQIASSTIWSAIAAGSNFAVAIDSGGNLWAWGNNSSSQLGDGTTTNNPSPEKIGSGYALVPTVVYTVPVNTATYVDVDAPIQAVFSEAMDPTSITTATFTLSGGVTGTVSYDASSNTATFTPSGSLHHHTIYTATVTTGVRDTYGNNMAANYTWTFTTEDKSTYCFIATAAYGSSLDPHVAVLRDFRDTCLLTNRAGRSFVHFYYQYSPPLAHLIARHPGLRTIARWALTPVVYGVMHPFAAGLIPPLSFVSIYLEKRRRRRRTTIRG